MVLPVTFTGAGAAAGALSDIGIDDEFITSAREKIQPGTSTLFALTSEAVMDRVEEAFKDVHPELIKTNLSAEDEANLRDAFAED